MSGPKLNEAPARMRKGKQRGPAGESTKATAKYLRVSAKKVRPVLNLIRGLSIGDAADTLRLCERDAATTIGKVLHSAVANAIENDDAVADELYVSACFADEGTTVKRWRPRARGRITRRRHRTSHITVIVSPMPAAQRDVARGKAAQVQESRARRISASRASAEQGAASARRTASGTTETVAGVSEGLSEATSDAASESTASTETASTETASTETASTGTVTVATDDDAALTGVSTLTDTSSTTAEPTATPAVVFFAAADGPADELNKIIGIGPKLAEELNELGLTTFAQVAALSDDDVERLDGVLPRSAEQIRDWRTQAQEILDGTWNRDTTNNT